MIPVRWDKTISKMLKPALPKTSRQFIRRQVAKGRAFTYLIDDLAVVVRPENEELVIVAAAGRGIIEGNKKIFEFAKNLGFKSIRYHTASKAFARLVSKRWPFLLVESNKNKNENVYRMIVE
jgi:hypothetical protein